MLTATVPGWTRRHYFGLGLLFAVYLGVRLLALSNAPVLEDHDSVAYLQTAEVLASGDGDRIAALPPDTLPLFPALGALASKLTGDVESGLRLASLACSAVLFWALVGIGRTFLSPVSVAAGLALLTFAPFFVRLSYSLLTQPTYLATVYAGTWALFAGFARPRWSLAALAGVLFAAAFLARVEGFLYLLVGPLLLFLALYSSASSLHAWRRALPAFAAFVISFGVLAAPQIAWVSHKMGSPSLNGRETWAQVFRQPDSRRYGEKIYGLDYSPTQVNIRYLQTHPEAARALAAHFDPLIYAKAALRNIAALSSQHLTGLVGAPALLLAAIAAVLLLSHGAVREVTACGLLIAAGLLPGVAFSVAERHIAVVGPLILLIAGAGLVGTADVITRLTPSRTWVRGATVAVLFILSLAPWIAPLRDLVSEADAVNTEYLRADYLPFERLVAERTAAQGSRPVIVARKGYLPYFARTDHIPLPYTDYDQLVNYMRGNGANLLFLEFNNFGEDWPAFAPRMLASGEHPNFRPLLERTDGFGEQLMLFELCPENCGGA
jgi:hypothetical protein